MKNVRDQLIFLIKEMPENITVEEILYCIYVQHKIQKGQQDIKEGISFTPI